jgi:hypothetical protein
MECVANRSAQSVFAEVRFPHLARIDFPSVFYHMVRSAMRADDLQLRSEFDFRPAQY